MIAASLATDAGTAWLGPVTPRSATSLQNGRFMMSAAGSTALESGNGLTVTASLSFKAAFPGAKTVYLNASSLGGLSSVRQNRGSWTVQ